VSECRIACRLALMSQRRNACSLAGSAPTLATKVLGSWPPLFPPDGGLGKESQPRALVGLSVSEQTAAGVWSSTACGGERRLRWRFAPSSTSLLIQTSATKEGVL
jgi:hypothetical protein